MRIVRGSDVPGIPASHESPDHPGVFKKILVQAGDLIQGRVQMINWAMLPAGKSFQAHFHEDMQEVFILVQGSARIDIEGESADLFAGDAVFVPVGAVHTMHNTAEAETVYIAIGVSRGQGGKTVVVDA